MKRIKKNRKTRKFLATCDDRVDTAYNQGLAMKNDGQMESLKIILEKRLEACGLGRVKVHFFGSRIIGLADAKSDLDTFVEIDDNFYADKNIQRDVMKLESIEAALKNSSEWRIKVNITNASVPVLKTIYVPRNLECDFTVSNGLGVQNSLIMCHLFGLQPEIVKFYQFMRIYLPRYDVKLDGYLMKLLVIFYFQNENCLPSVSRVQQGLNVKSINGWNVQFDPNRTLSDYNLKIVENFKYHVPNFFQFYSTFDYKKQVMSVHDGISKMRSSYEYQEEVKDDYLMCIFGPINMKHNIGKYLSMPTVITFKKKCDGIFFPFLKFYTWHFEYEKKKQQLKEEPIVVHGRTVYAVRAPFSLLKISSPFKFDDIFQ